MTAAEIYDKLIRPLPAPVRFELATRILNEIPSRAIVDYSDEWSEEDMRNAQRAAMLRLDEEESREADREVEALCSNPAFVEYIEGCVERGKAGPRISLRELRQKYEKEDGAPQGS